MSVVVTAGLLEFAGLVPLLANTARDTSGQMVESLRLGRGAETPDLAVVLTILELDLAKDCDSTVAFFGLILPFKLVVLTTPLGACLDADAGDGYAIEDEDEEAAAFTERAPVIFSFLVCQIFVAGGRTDCEGPASGDVERGGGVGGVGGGGVAPAGLPELTMGCDLSDGLEPSDVRDEAGSDPRSADGGAGIVEVARLLHTDLAAPRGSAFVPKLSLPPGFDPESGWALLEPVSRLPFDDFRSDDALPLSTFGSFLLLAPTSCHPTTSSLSSSSGDVIAGSLGDLSSIIRESLRESEAPLVDLVPVFIPASTSCSEGS